jgi:hypothetical protein
VWSPTADFDQAGHRSASGDHTLRRGRSTGIRTGGSWKPGSNSMHDLDATVEGHLRYALLGEQAHDAG